MGYKVTKEPTSAAPGPNAKPFQTFEDLGVYQAAREFRKAIYRVARGLPEFEKYGLASQMRRAAVSLTNNIAEGHGRLNGYLRFLRKRSSSVTEPAGEYLNDEAFFTGFTM